MGIFFYFASAYVHSLSFPAARCTILARSIITHTPTHPQGQDGYTPQFTLRVQPNNGKAKYQTQSNYDLSQVSTGNYGQVAGIVNHFAIGQQYPCWYNPQNPYVTILDRSPNLWLLAIGPSVILAGMAFFSA
jgi:hypothetical protein